MEFPNPCCRCGFCCLAVSCITAQAIFKIAKTEPCPALRFENGAAICIVALEHPEIIGVGLGCCIKATAYRRGEAHDFASLSPILKKHAAAAKRFSQWGELPSFE